MNSLQKKRRKIMYRESWEGPENFVAHLEETLLNALLREVYDVAKVIGCNRDSFEVLTRYIQELKRNGFIKPEHTLSYVHDTVFYSLHAHEIHRTFARVIRGAFKEGEGNYKQICEEINNAWRLQKVAPIPGTR